MKPTADFERWALGFSGCDGGDIGSPQRPSTWICGIEWGGSHDPETLGLRLGDDVNAPPTGYDRWEENLAYIFNWQAVKLLAAIACEPVGEYRDHARRVAPFVAGSQGHFKLNLYPLSFKNTSASRWSSDFARITGFAAKQDYMSWCRSTRFPRMRRWAAEARPRLIVGLGKTYADGFGAAFLEEGTPYRLAIVEGCELRWAVNRDGTLVVVLPFMVNRNGLVRNSAIQAVGARVADLMLSQE